MLKFEQYYSCSYEIILKENSMILKQNKCEIVRQNSRQLLKVKNGSFILLSLFKLDSFKDIRILLLFSFENQEVIAIVIKLPQTTLHIFQKIIYE